MAGKGRTGKLNGCRAKSPFSYGLAKTGGNDESHVWLDTYLHNYSNWIPRYSCGRSLVYDANAPTDVQTQPAPGNG